MQRDIRDLANIERLSEVPRLLALLASRAGHPVNYADLSRTLAIPQTTLKRYMALLETTFILRLLPAWFTNIGKRLTKAPKLLLADTGLLSHLLGIDGDRLRTDRTLFGHVLENFVAMRLIKQLGWSDRRCRPYHFRAESGAEVDLVLEDSAEKLVGIEVKGAVTLEARLSEASKRSPESPGRDSSEASFFIPVRRLFRSGNGYTPSRSTNSGPDGTTIPDGRTRAKRSPLDGPAQGVGARRHLTLCQGRIGSRCHDDRNAAKRCRSSRGQRSDRHPGAKNAPVIRVWGIWRPPAGIRSRCEP